MKCVNTGAVRSREIAHDFGHLWWSSCRHSGVTNCFVGQMRITDQPPDVDASSLWNVIPSQEHSCHSWQYPLFLSHRTIRTPRAKHQPLAMGVEYALGPVACSNSRSTPVRTDRRAQAGYRRASAHKVFMPGWNAFPSHFNGGQRHACSAS